VPLSRSTHLGGEVQWGEGEDRGRLEGRNGSSSVVLFLISVLARRTWFWMPGPKQVCCREFFSGWYAPQNPLLGESKAWPIDRSARASKQSKRILDMANMFESAFFLG
jgi:hypothetical protein